MMLTQPSAPLARKTALQPRASAVFWSTFRICHAWIDEDLPVVAFMRRITSDFSASMQILASLEVELRGVGSSAVLVLDRGADLGQDACQNEQGDGAKQEFPSGAHAADRLGNRRRTSRGAGGAGGAFAATGALEGRSRPQCLQTIAAS